VIVKNWGLSLEGAEVFDSGLSLLQFGLGLWAGRLVCKTCASRRGGDQRCERETSVQSHRGEQQTAPWTLFDINPS